MRTGLLNTENEKSKRELYNVLKELKPGSYVYTIKKNRNIRSMSANKYYHAILNIIAISTGHTHEELHEALKLKFNYEVIFFPKGGSQMIGKSTSNMDTKEFAGYINRVKQWALDEFDIRIPESNNIDEAKWMEFENLYNENFNGF
jgi:hypothetical protein